jgi:sulfur-oxidizing protein SoxX
LVGVALAVAWMSSASMIASQAFAGDLMKAWGTVAVLPIAAAVPTHPPARGRSAAPAGSGSYQVAADRQSRARALLAYEINGDAVLRPLGGLQGDAARGKAIVLDRRKGNCLICHVFPLEGEPFQGESGPPMAGVAARLTRGQIRLRLIDQSRLNPETIMPPFYRIAGLTNVAPEYDGRPALTAQEIEDVVAYLASLTE